jgi:hypothetical protein
VVIKNVPGDGKGVQRLQFVDHKLILTAPFESVDYRLSWTELYPFLDTSLDVSLKASYPLFLCRSKFNFYI